nr:MAG TPA: hypothetical protein [Caudoviricetes sp.]
MCPDAGNLATATTSDCTIPGNTDCINRYFLDCIGFHSQSEDGTNGNHAKGQNDFIVDNGLNVHSTTSFPEPRSKNKMVCYAINVFKIIS